MPANELAHPSPVEQRVQPAEPAPAKKTEKGARNDEPKKPAPQKEEPTRVDTDVDVHTEQPRVDPDVPTPPRIRARLDHDGQRRKSRPVAP